MIFLKWTDLTTRIKSNILLDALNITNPDSENVILTQIEDEAIQLVAGYLNNRYNMHNAFNQIDTDRNTLLIGLVADIVSYLVMIRTSTDVISDIRTQRYNDAIKLLKDLESGKMKINLPEKNDEYQNTSHLKFSADIRTAHDY
jgi:phage gp36-like protein